MIKKKFKKTQLFTEISDHDHDLQKYKKKFPNLHQIWGFIHNWGFSATDYFLTY